MLKSVLYIANTVAWGALLQGSMSAVALAAGSQWIHSVPVVEVEYQVKVPSGRRSLPFSKAWCQQRQQVKEDCQSIQQGIERLLDVSNETEPKFSEFACWFTSSEKALRRSQKIHCEISAQALGKDGYNELEANQQTIARETQTQVQDFFQSLGLSEEGRQATSPIKSQVELLAGPQPIKSKDGTFKCANCWWTMRTPFLPFCHGRQNRRFQTNGGRVGSNGSLITLR